jgi:hypothetical protein
VFRMLPCRGELADPLPPRCRRDCRRLELHATPVVHGPTGRRDEAKTTALVEGQNTGSNLLKSP